MDNQPVVVTPKPWYESRTIITNAVVLIVTVATFLLDQQRAGLLPFTLDEKWLVFIMGIVGVINVYLRTITEAPIEGGK